ncbi:MAG: hypothetical protein U0930_12010 [Pirellulales bacterium]
MFTFIQAVLFAHRAASYDIDKINTEKEDFATSIPQRLRSCLQLVLVDTYHDSAHHGHDQFGRMVMVKQMMVVQAEKNQGAEHCQERQMQMSPPGVQAN